MYERVKPKAHTRISQRLETNVHNHFKDFKE
jgi:hypothetical protein